ncbi:hypothetical protein Q3G72_029285 [Acer saccharum]|nr:hypothetical protein Q3G72_029285 [Acer saccharum]
MSPKARATREAKKKKKIGRKALLVVVKAAEIGSTKAGGFEFLLQPWRSRSEKKKKKKREAEEEEVKKKNSDEEG